MKSLMAGIAFVWLAAVGVVVAAGAPTLPGFKEYPITFWWGPPAAETTEARYREMAQAGFNLAAPTGP